MMWRNAFWIIAALVSALAASFTSKQVSDTRKAMLGAERQIASDTREVARLRSELTARARPERLEALNAAFLGLGAPTSDRYFASVDALVAFAGRDVPRVMQIGATPEGGVSLQAVAAEPLVEMRPVPARPRTQRVAAPVPQMDTLQPRLIAAAPDDNAALDAMMLRLDAQP